MKKVTLLFVFVLIVILFMIVVYRDTHFYTISINSLDFVESNKTRDIETGKVPKFTEKELVYIDNIERVVKNKKFFCSKDFICNIGNNKYEIKEKNINYYYPIDFIFDVQSNTTLKNDNNFETINSYLLTNLENSNEYELGIAKNKEKNYLVYVPEEENNNIYEYIFSYNFEKKDFF